MTVEGLSDDSDTSIVTTSTTSTTSIIAPTTPTPTNVSSTPVGAIVGGVVGGVAGIALLSLGAFFFFYRRKKGGEQPQAPAMEQQSAREQPTTPHSPAPQYSAKGPVSSSHVESPAQSPVGSGQQGNPSPGGVGYTAPPITPESTGPWSSQTAVPQNVYEAAVDSSQYHRGTMQEMA